MRNEALIKAMEDLARAARSAGLAARVISLPESEPAKAEKPERFEHTDGADSLVVRPHHAFDQTLVTFVNGDGVRLRQDAVNGLAQYLDQYRTDRQCSPDTNGAPEPREHWCGRNSDHPGHEYTREEGTRSVRCLGVSNGVYGS